MLLEYIWIDGNGGLRSKTRVMKRVTNKVTVSDLPIWNYDGSSTNQATGDDSEVFIRPQSIFPDPFRTDPFRKKNNNYLVLCDTLLPNGTPHPSNTRVRALEIFNKNPESKPMFGIEQEFFLHEGDNLICNPKKSQGDYYCGVGGGNAIGRECIEEAFDNCLYAGLSLTGLNAEVAPAQWEFQVCDYGINVSDQLYIMRYIINRTAEKYGWNMCIHPKPMEGDWNGSGCHTNFSTEEMRNEGGYSKILKCISKMSEKHTEHMKQYGKDNVLRMSGRHETADYNIFTYGVADRGSSVRIPRDTERNKCGYLEDRRPGSNMDPYIVTSLLFECSL